MEKLWKGAQPLQPNVAINPLICSPPSSRRRLSERGGTGLQPSPPAITRLPSGKNSSAVQARWAVTEACSKYDDHWVKLVRNHRQKWTKMAQKGNTAFQESFAMVRPLQSIKLLPWCISSEGPSCYLSEALVATLQQGKNALPTVVAPELEESPTPGSSSSQAHLTGTPPPLAPLLPDLPFMGSPPGGAYLLSS